MRERERERERESYHTINFKYSVGLLVAGIALGSARKIGVGKESFWFYGSDASWPAGLASLLRGRSLQKKSKMGNEWSSSISCFVSSLVSYSAMCNISIV